MKNKNLKEYKLCDLYKMDSGLNSTKEQAGHGSDFLSFKDIYNNIILPDELTEKMNTTKEEQNKYSIKKGDIFLTRTSEVIDELAMSSVALKDYPNSTFSGFAKRLRPTQTNITYDKFMAFFLRSKYFRKIINNKAFMTLRASFNDNIFRDIKILIPDYETQVKIGNMFCNIEYKIRLNNQINNTLEEMMKTLYQRWFLEFEFPNEEGKPYKLSGGKMVWNELLKRNIPEKWNSKNIMDFITWEGTSQPPKSYFIYEYKEGYIRFIQNRDYEDSSHMTYIPENKALGKCSRYDILMDKYGDAGRTRFGLEGAYNVALSKINVKDLFYREYIRSVLSSESTYNYLHNSSMASTRASLNENNVSYINIVVPDKNIISQYNKFANNYIETKLQIYDENKRLTELRDYLLPMLMNGQINVDDVKI